MTQDQLKNEVLELSEKLRDVTDLKKFRIPWRVRKALKSYLKKLWKTKE